MPETPQVSETCPHEWVNTADNFVGSKVQFTLNAWKELTSDKWMLDTMQGVSVSFESDPSGSSYRQTNFSESEEKLVEAEIQKLESKQVIREVESEPGEFVFIIINFF